MADLKRIQHTISKGMKLYCTVEEALEDVIVVSLKHKTKEFRGILLDSSERHLPPGLCFKDESSAPKAEGEKEGNSSADGPDQTQPKDVKGVSLDCRYSYNNDPAKYNEQPLNLTSFISIRPARGKHVRNIRLRPRQTLCSKCKTVIHDSKSKSPNRAQKPDGDGQTQEVHPHNTRYRAAQAGKPSDSANTVEGPTLRSGVRNRRADSTQSTNPKVLLENIRPKRDVKPTAKKKEADAVLKNKQDNSKKSAAAEESSDSGVTTSSSRRKELDESARLLLDRSISVDNPSALSQYNKQPVVRLDKSAVNYVNVRKEESREEKQEKAPPLFLNMRSTPKITISFGGAGDRDVLKIQPRLPGEEMKSPDGHSTADESPASPPPPESPPQRKAKKASKRTRDKQRYRIVNDTEPSSEVTATGIKISSSVHKKHKRKHRHRHASSEDENFNSDVGQAKLPSLVTKLVIPPASVNDTNAANEKKGDAEVLKDNSNGTPKRQEESVSTSMDVSEMDYLDKKEEESTSVFVFNDDPLNLKSLANSPAVDRAFSKPVSRQSSPMFGLPSPISVRSVIDKDPEASFDHARSETSDKSASRSDVKSFEMWASPAEKLEPPDFDDEGSPARIEAPPFQSDDSQDGLIIGPIISSIALGKSPVKDERLESMDSLSLTPPPPSQRSEEMRKESELDDDDDRKSPVPYGTGVFEDLTPDEDEGDHDDSNTSQPMYQLPLSKKPRMMYDWHTEGLGSSYLQRKAAGYGSSSLFSRSSSRMYTNGPSSYYPHGGSMYSGNPTGYPNSQTIQNSPTPIIQKSPVPIFNYHSSRYQGSPNRRFNSSPQRRYDSVPESSTLRHQSVIDGGMHPPSQSSSRYPRHGIGQFAAPRDGQSAAANDFHSPPERSDLSHSVGSRYPTKYDSRASNIRYQPLSDKSSDSRYHAHDSAGKHADENSSRTKSLRAAESGSTLRYVSTTGDSSSRFSVPLDSSASVSQYSGQSSSSASLPHYSAHPSEGSLPKQYPPLGSTDSRFQPLGDSRYSLPCTVTIPSSPSPLALQTDSRSSSSLSTASVYHTESERKSSVLSGARYETVDTSALFMAHSHKSGLPNDGGVPHFLGKPLVVSTASAISPVARVSSTDSGKPGSIFSTPAGSLNTPLSFLHPDPQLLSPGGGGGVPNSSMLFHSPGQLGISNLARRQSSSALSQGHMTVNVSDSDDDADSNAVPGLPAGAMSGGGGSHSQDPSRLPMMKIQAVNLANIRAEDGREIKVGDVQWGKVQGFPWWPCRVKTIRITHRDHREQELIVTHVCHVSWFGSSTVSDLTPMELRPFREEFNKRHMKKKRGPYQLAVQQAMLAVGMTQLPMGDPVRSHHPQPSPGGPFSLMHDLVS